MEKRALTRFVLSLNAECSAPGMEKCAVEIRDFCLGGVFVAYLPFYESKPAQKRQFINGDSIEIRCTIPAFQNEKALSFQGNVVRSDETGAGVAFVNPDPDALHLLHDFAKNFRANQPLQFDNQPAKNISPAKIPPQNVHPLLLECARIAEERANPIINSFLEIVTKRLLALSMENRSSADGNIYYTALNVFNTQENAFKHKFFEQIKKQLYSFTEHPNKPVAQPEQKFSTSTLSLIEDDEFEEWLAYSDIARKLEAEFQYQLYELNQRIGILTNDVINQETNPFAPATLAKSFQDTLKILELDQKTLQISYTSFKEVLTTSLGELYDNINQYLNDNGVTLDLKQQYKIKNPDIGIPASTQVVQNLTDKHFLQQPSPTGTAAGQIPKHQTAIGNFAAIHPHSDQFSHDMPSQLNWYSLIQHLSNLQQNIAQQGTYQPNGTAQPPVDSLATQIAPAPQFYTSDELLSALSRVQLPDNQRPLAGNFQQHVKSQLMSVLTHGNTDIEQKQLPEHEDQVLDIAGSLFNSVLEDKLVASNVRPWLQQLSIPMYKMALQDESLFSDKSHLARQVINSLAQLELYGEDKNDVGNNAVRTRINNLIAEVTSADEVTPQLFEKMLKHLNLLIKFQDKAYQENLADVHAACEEEQRTNPITVPEIPTHEDVGLLAWKKQVRRLKVGDWILSDINSNPQRLRLAWISKGLERFVFVNVKGLKALTLNQAELAQRLRDGSSTVLDDGGEPLIDRAQTAMLQKMHRQLLHESTHDHLTGLINRREFERFLGQALASSHQLSQHHTICYIDLDQFSAVNNTFGYSGGDRLLMEVTKLLQDELGDRGMIARIGGDEFGMLFENCSVEDALEITARQKTAMQNYRFISDQKSLAISFSAGLVPIAPESDSVAALLQAAETSCRSARSKGTNYIQVYNPDDEELARQKQTIQWLTKIDEALDNDSLVLRYQPISHISNNKNALHHAEILLSVADEQGNLISPVDLIFAAESFRRMVLVDRWVIQNVFRWMGSHEQELKKVGGFAINLSGASLNEERFIDFILQQAVLYKAPMDKVCFEVTETAGIANLSSASEFILEIKKTGCTFALDDFGSGLSSYAYLKNLPVDYLKIDGVFVKNMDTNPYDYAVVKSITEIGHFMGKEIIAEYVENESILGMLRDIGVDYAQGYVISKPLTLSSLAMP